LALNGQTGSIVANGDVISAGVTLNNNSDKRRDYVLALVVLNQNNKVLAVKVSSGYIEANTINQHIKTPEFLVEEEGVSTKIIVLNNWKDMVLK
jgi:hypothetical protein